MAYKKAGEWAAKLGYSTATTPLQLHKNGIVLKNDKSFPFCVYIWFTDDVFFTGRYVFSATSYKFSSTVSTYITHD
jgi:hypothetical protein